VAPAVDRTASASPKPPTEPVLAGPLAAEGDVAEPETPPDMPEGDSASTLPTPAPGSLAEALARAAAMPRAKPPPEPKKPVQNPYSDIEMPDGDWG